MSEEAKEYLVNQTHKDTEYIYAGKTLTITISCHLILEQLPRNKGYTNPEITQIVIHAHEQLGGLINTTGNISRHIIKPALIKLKKDGFINNPIQDTWIIYDENRVSEYKYCGIRLTPTIARELILKYIPKGKPLTRNEIAQIVIHRHADLGGSSMIDTLKSLFKKALGYLKRKGIIKNPKLNTWILTDGSVESKNDHVSVANTIITPIQESDEDIGEGKGIVYVCYFPRDRENAELKKESVWACKIGETRSTVDTRFLSERKTMMSEYPHVALVINHDKQSILETVIHKTLELRNKKIENAPGNEWYLTNPDEIKEIYYCVTGEYENSLITKILKNGE